MTQALKDLGVLRRKGEYGPFYFIFLIKNLFIYLEREKESMGVGEGEKIFKQSLPPSTMPNVEPDVGLNPTT